MGMQNRESGIGKAQARRGLAAAFVLPALPIPRFPFPIPGAEDVP